MAAFIKSRIPSKTEPDNLRVLYKVYLILYPVTYPPKLFGAETEGMLNRAVDRFGAAFPGPVGGGQQDVWSR